MGKSLGVVLCLALVLFAVSGCAGKGLTQPEARGLCLTWSADGGPQSDGGSSCLQQNDICQEMFPGELMEAMDQDQCKAHCDEVKLAQNRLHPVDGCGLYVTRAWNLCVSQCRSKH